MGIMTLFAGSAADPLTLTAAVSRAVDDSAVTPGVLGFVVVAALGVATWLLIRSMNKQFRKIDLPDDQENDHQPEDRSGPGGDRDGSAER